MGQGGSGSIQRLLDEKLLNAADGVPANDHETWRHVFTVPINSSDVNAVIPMHTVRLLRKTRPATLASLLYNCIRIIDRATALQLGLEKYVSSSNSRRRQAMKGAMPVLAENIILDREDEEEDAQVRALYFTEAEAAAELVKNQQRLKRNREEGERRRDEILKDAANTKAKSSTVTIVPATLTAVGSTAGTTSSPAPQEVSGPAPPTPSPSSSPSPSGTTETVSVHGTVPIDDELRSLLENPHRLARSRGVVAVPRPLSEMSNQERRAFQNAIALIYRILPIALEDDPSVAPVAASPNTVAAEVGEQRERKFGGADSSPPSEPPTQSSSSSSIYSASNGGALYADTFLQAFFRENRTCFPPSRSNGHTEEDVNNNSGGRGQQIFSGGGIANSIWEDNGHFYSAVGTLSLAEVLVNCLARSAFVPGFTVDATQFITCNSPINMPLVDSGLVWCPGVGFTAAREKEVSAVGSRNGGQSPASWTNSEWAITNRRAVIDALMVTLSGSLYTPDPTRVDVFLETTTSPDRCPLMPTLVCSLLNTVCTYSTFGSLPYSSHFVGQLERFVLTSSELVNVLLTTHTLYPTPYNYRHAIVPGLPSNFSPQQQTDQPAGAPSQSYKPPLSELRAPSLTAYSQIVMRHYHTAWSVLISASASEVSFVLKGLLHLVNNRTYSKSTRLPGTQRRMAHHDAFFLLMWRLVDRCPNFFEPLTTESDVAIPFLIPLLDYGLAAKDDGSLFANAQIVAFTLMRLSSARDFAILLNAPIVGHIPFNVPPLSKGAYTDLIIVAMLQLLNARQQPTRAEQLSRTQQQQQQSNASDQQQPSATKPLYRPAPTAIMSIHETCAIIICNISPYVTSMLTTTSLSLMSFFELAVRPSWLRLHSSYPNVLSLIVESFANIIQYQYRACPTLLYNLCRERAKIHKIYKEIKEPFLLIQQQQRARQGEGGSGEGFAGAVVPSSLSTAPPLTSSPTTATSMSSASSTVPPSATVDNATKGEASPTQQQQQPHHQESQMVAEADAASPTCAQLTLASEGVLPMSIRERIKVGTLVSAVDAAEPIIVRAVAKAAPALPDPVTILSNTTLVGLLPAPHPITVRKFEPHPTTDAWTNAVAWSFIFMNEPAMGDPQRIRLFSLDQRVQ